MGDPYDLRRFRAAQDQGGVYDQALAELRAGEKQAHWMWFVFPQIAGLGGSAMAKRYAIRSLDEARAYLGDPVLGRRLLECAWTVVELDESNPRPIFGIDAMKLRSSMTLFERAAPQEPVFREILEQYFAGERDEATLERLP